MKACSPPYVPVGRNARGALNVLCSANGWQNASTVLNEHSPFGTLSTCGSRTYKYRARWRLDKQKNERLVLEQAAAARARFANMIEDHKEQIGASSKDGVNSKSHSKDLNLHVQQPLPLAESVGLGKRNPRTYIVTEGGYTWLTNEIEKQRPELEFVRLPHNTGGSLLYRGRSPGPEKDSWLPLKVCFAGQEAFVRKTNRGPRYFRFDFASESTARLPGLGLIFVSLPTKATAFKATLGLESALCAKANHTISTESDTGDDHQGDELSWRSSRSHRTSVMIPEEKFVPVSELAEALLSAWNDVAEDHARPVSHWLFALALTPRQQRRATLLGQLFEKVYSKIGALPVLSKSPSSGNETWDCFAFGKPLFHRTVGLRYDRGPARYRVKLVKLRSCRSRTRLSGSRRVRSYQEQVPFSETNAPEFVVVLHSHCDEQLVLQGVWILPRPLFQHCLVVEGDLASGKTDLSLFTPECQPGKKKTQQTREAQLPYYIPIRDGRVSDADLQRARNILSGHSEQAAVPVWPVAQGIESGAPKLALQTRQ